MKLDPLGLVTADDLRSAVETEMLAADAIYGPFTSSHEGLGVLVEEVDELRDAIRSNRMDRVCGEALQVAAVAIRLAAATYDPAFRKRSGA